MNFVVEPLASHSRANFDSGEPELDAYFRDRVGQDVRRLLTRCYVALAGADEVAGFYTLSAASVAVSEVPDALGRRMPRYADFPVTLLGRLAVDRKYAGQGLGAAMVGDALERAGRSEIGNFALMVDAKNQQAHQFYVHVGFTPLTLTSRRLIIPLKRSG